MNRMRRAVAVAAVISLLGAGGCDGSERTRPDGSSVASRSSDPVRKEERAKPDRPPAHARRPTHPDRASVENLGLTRADRRRVDRAVADLRDLGFWRPLTRHVDYVLISTRPGPERVPGDGHLADAVMNVHLGQRPGVVCDVMIFSQALVDDVARQEIYYSQGRLSAPAPTLREFWAVILGHELAHCSKRGQRGEAYSTVWEQRILEAFGSSRLGTPSG